MLLSAKHCINLIKKNKSSMLFMLVTIVAMFLRYLARNLVSYDMATFLIPWYTAIKNGGGLAMLNVQIGDYGLLYQTIIAFFSYVNIRPIYLYKTLSIVFDFLLAISVFYFIAARNKDTFYNNNDEKRKLFCLSYAYVLLLPPVVLNSAFWGQSDSIYSFFLLWSLWFLYKGQYKLTFLVLGCAFSFKLQSILIVPLFVFLCYYKKRFSIFNFLITFFTFWFSGIVTYLHGRNLLAGIEIYMYQTVEYKRMWMNIPSFWIIGGNDYYDFRLFIFAIALTFIILGIGFKLIVLNKKSVDSFEEIVGVAVFVEWTCMLFLPAMHERYTYVLDLLLLMMTFFDKKYIKYAIVSITLSIISYNYILFSGPPLNYRHMLVYLFCWFHYSYDFFEIAHFFGKSRD